MPTSTKSVCSIASLVVLAAACGSSVTDIDLPQGAGAGGMGTGTGGAGATGGTTGGVGTTGGTSGAGSATGGVGGSTGGAGGSVMAGAAGGPPVTGGVGGAAGAGGGSGGLPGGMGGMAGTSVDPTGGTAGTDVPAGGMAGTAGTGGDPTGGTAGMGAGAGSGGSAGAPPTGPYAPRAGTFKVLAYSRTGGFPHTEAINAGKTMLMAMGTKQGFEVAFSDNAADVNAQNLEQYEVFFGLNPTGDNLSADQKAAFQEWMEMKNGGFAGVHSSTDHEAQWAFWHEVTGQYYQRHDLGTFTTQNIQWQAGVEDYVFVAGLPSPWQRAEEWYHFDSYSTWSQKPGFKILNLVTTSQGGTRPVSFIREWGNFRSFYTSLGHNGSNYSEATFVRHVGAGIMWAARREALFKP